MISSLNLKQHILDLIITRSEDDIINSVCISDPGISDHYAVTAKICLQKPNYPKKEVSYRKLKSINYEDFCADIKRSSLISDSGSSLPINAIVNNYETVLTALLDTYAPVKKKIITLRPFSPWYTDEIHSQKMIKRRLERRWRASKNLADRELYVEQCSKVTNMIFHSKMTFYSDLIDDLKLDQRNLFNTVDKMLHRKEEKRYPSSENPDKLANDFANFFNDKITKIRTAISVQASMNHMDQNQDIPNSLNSEFSSFNPVTTEQLSKLLNKMSSKSCGLDPIPSFVFKKCAHVLTPVITNAVNLSLEHAEMPSNLKIALLSPLLKKKFLDHEEFASFRPISNLKLMSKAVEKVVASQVNIYINENNLNEVYQSAYKENHSTETAMVKVQNDILKALDNQSSVILLLLDLSAAFDTVDHQILLSRLTCRFGFKGKVIDWFSSYLSNRRQFVEVEGGKSSNCDLNFGLPQGSILGPMLFLLYTSPLADLIRKHDMGFHLYADDTQLYITFKSNNEGDLQLAKSNIENCVREIDMWMSKNMLKMNRDKTEVLILSPRHRPQPSITSVTVCNEIVLPSNFARNIGVTFDSSMSMENHISEICKSAFYHLRNISRIRKYLSHKSATILVHAFITSKLDFCNSLFYGLPKKLIQKLQSVQNAAARLVSLSHIHDHITPILKELHWLPVEQRIIFKVILLTFKSTHGLAPLYLQDLIKPYVPTRQLRSSTKNLLTTETYKLRTYGFRAFSVSAPVLWNSLPEDIRNCHDLNAFKSFLKTYLFKVAFN